MLHNTDVPQRADIRGTELGLADGNNVSDHCKLMLLLLVCL